MTIGVDIRVLARGTRSGIEEYAINILSRLPKIDKSINYKFFYNAFRKADLDFDWLRLPNVELKIFNMPNRFFDISSYCFNFPPVDRLLGGADVFFSPHIFLAALSGQCPSVATFHDLSFERYKEFYSIQKRYWHFSMDPKRQAKRAQKIIAVSESTKKDLVEIYKIPAGKVQVVYSGADPVSRIPYPASGTAEIRKKYGLPDKYILYLGTIEPRKNIVGLIKAFELFCTKYQALSAKYKLVIAGAKGWLYRDVFRAYMNSPQKSDIVFTGFVENDDKREVCKSADLFVYPSFFEGFGFPPLEAMAAGVPVIASSSSSLSEAVGSGALTVDPYNIGELAWAMNELLANQRIRNKMIEKGREQVKKFSWEKCAQETLEILISTPSEVLSRS